MPYSRASEQVKSWVISLQDRRGIGGESGKSCHVLFWRDIRRNPKRDFGRPGDEGDRLVRMTVLPTTEPGQFQYRSTGEAKRVRNCLSRSSRVLD